MNAGVSVQSGFSYSAGLEDETSFTLSSSFIIFTGAQSSFPARSSQKQIFCSLKGVVYAPTHDEIPHQRSGRDAFGLQR